MVYSRLRVLLTGVMTLCILTVMTANATSQTLEAGGTVGAACIGNDGVFCDPAESRQLLFGGHVSLWLAERMELSMRVARLDRRPLRYRATQDPAVEVTIDDRSREFVSFLFIYHFLHDRPVRPSVGLGSGWFADAARVSCQPVGCEQLLPSQRFGKDRIWRVDAIWQIGLSGTVRERWVWRGGWQAHRFANDENSTEELFVSVGYRLGRN